MTKCDKMIDLKTFYIEEGSRHLSLNEQHSHYLNDWHL